MKNTFFLLITLCLFSHQAQAQYDSITTFNGPIHDFQTFDNKLFMAGDFIKNGNQNCYWSAYYDGTRLTRHSTMIGGTGLSALAEFDGELFGVGSIQHWQSIGVSKWDGSTWVNGGSTNYSHSVIYADGDHLYEASDNGIIRVMAKGGSWQPFYDFQGDGDISCIIRYNNHLIIAGRFDMIGGVSAKNIAQWDGTNWQPLGSGILGSIKTLAVYKNELYVGGKISEAGGLSVEEIAKWDGSTWTAVGGGVTDRSLNGIQDMVVHDNYLWVVGDFPEVGNVITHDVALWNGTRWFAAGISHNDYFVNVSSLSKVLILREYSGILKEKA